MVLIQAQIEAELAREQALQSEQDAKKFEEWNNAIKDMLSDSDNEGEKADETTNQA